MNKADIFQRLQFPLAESVVNNMTKLDSVQVMRAMAALAVCSGHLFHEVYLFNPSSTIKFLNELPWGMGVDLFFVISGYIMMKTSRNCFGRDGAASGFFLKRLVRIVPSYWFFTTLMLISTLLVPQELNSGVFTLPHTIMSYLFIPHFNPRVEGLLQPILGLGWTLVYEMFFYIVFAICLLRKEKEGLLALTTVFVCVFLTARLGIWPEALNTFWGNSVMFEFLLGVAAYKIAEPEPLMHRKLIAAAVIAVGATACAAIAGLFTSERLFFAGVPALILFILLLNMPAGSNRKSYDIMFWLVLIGDASYALYLSHPFIMVIVKKTLFTLHLDAIGLPILSLCYIVNTLILACVCAIAYHLLIEKPLTSYLQSMLRFRGFGRRWRPIRPAPE